MTSSSPVDFFEPCATAEWEVLMDENSQLTTKLKMPEEIMGKKPCDPRGMNKRRHKNTKR